MLLYNIWRKREREAWQRRREFRVSNTRTDCGRDSVGGSSCFRKNSWALQRRRIAKVRTSNPWSGRALVLGIRSLAVGRMS